MITTEKIETIFLFFSRKNRSTVLFICILGHFIAAKINELDVLSLMYISGYVICNPTV